MFEGQLDTDVDGYLVTKNYVLTVYLACTPAAMSKTAAIARPSPPPGTGCMAALEAERFLEEQGH